MRDVIEIDRYRALGKEVDAFDSNLCDLLYFLGFRCEQIAILVGRRV